MKYLGITCLALSLFASGCDTSQDIVVAEVASHQITANNLRTFVEKLPGDQHDDKTDDQLRRQYLQSLIDRQLLLLEARSLSLDTTRAVQQVVKEDVANRIRAQYRAQEINAKVKISAAEVEQYFKEEGFDRERKLSAILVKTRQEIDQIVSDLEAGRPFEELARAHSIDERSSRQGGELGYIGREILARLHIPADLFKSLPLGEVSQPINAGSHWHIMRFLEERPSSFEKYRPLVEEELLNERLAQAEEEHFELLAERFALHLDTGGLDEIIAAYRKADLAPLENSQTALYTWDKGSLTVAQSHEMLRRRAVRHSLADSAQAISVLKSYVLHPFLLEEAGRRTGLAESEQIRQLQNRYLEDTLLEQLKKTAVAAKVVITEEETQQYYDANPKLFRHENSIWIEEVLLASEEEARNLREQIENGALFEDLVGQSLRAGAAANKARLHFHPRERAAYPQLIDAVVKTAKGQLAGPVEVRGGYSVFRVLYQEEDSIEPYKTANRRARALLRHERTNKILTTFVKNLRQKYASQIKVDGDRLQEALPDSLLVSLRLEKETTP